MENIVSTLKKGEPVQLHKDETGKIYYFIELMDGDGDYIKLSDKKDDPFGNKFVQSIWSKRAES